MKTNYLFKCFLACAAFVMIATPGNAQVSRQRVTRPTLQRIDQIRIKNAGELVRSPDFTRLTKQSYTMEGFFVSDPEPMLLTNMKWYDANTPMPDSVFIPIRGEIRKTLMRDAAKYHGAFIRIEGNLSVEKRRTLKGESNEAVIISTKIPSVLKPKPVESMLPSIYNICKINPKICQLGPILSKDYALLYSGGINSYNAKSRYWNDLKFMYKTLKSKYGYTDNQIVVVYKDGVAADAEMTVDYAASQTGLKNAIDFLRTKVTSGSDFFFFITNHGGGYNTAEGVNYSGVTDAAPLDETDAYKYDETVFYYNETNNTITDDSLAVFLNRVSSLTSGNKMVAVLEPCFSGGLIRDLRGANHIVISAANEFQFSWGGGPGNHDIFSYYFTCALNGADHTGVAVDADTNDDGKVSILEAFIYARHHDTADEEPLLDDSGDGVGTHNPTSTGTDGTKASTKFL